MENSAYYNTTNSFGAELRDAISAAKKQDDAVMAIFRALGSASPSRVEQVAMANHKRWPLTSIRRSINSLTNAGRLFKTDRKVTGGFGRDEHVWIVNNKPVEN